MNLYLLIKRLELLTQFFVNISIFYIFLMESLQEVLLEIGRLQADVLTHQG